MRTHALITLACIALTACAEMPTGAGAPKRITGIEDDRFSSIAKVVGHQEYVNPFGGLYRGWFIRSFIDKKTRAVSHQLYVDLKYYGSWRFFGSASDDTARPLKTARIGSNVDSCRGVCTLEETVTVELEDKTLRERAAGFQIKLTARSGDSVILTISPDQIRLQQEAIAGYLAANPRK